jgi:uncharacterized cupin superfamily protein
MAVAASTDVRYTPAPIKPEWIRSGYPHARSADLVASADGGASANFWDCTAGQFEWQFAWDETVLILEGSVRVSDSLGNAATLRTGDVAHFTAGTSYVWEVDHYVRKIAFHRRPVRSAVSSLMQHRHRFAAVASMLAVTLVRLVLRK